MMPSKSESNMGGLALLGVAERVYGACVEIAGRNVRRGASRGVSRLEESKVDKKIPTYSHHIWKYAKPATNSLIG